ncbi:two component transcriptional regulator, LuxR family [Desulfotomaculum arcticum]|uniref:Stage 0 sporulation protein A homolog n=1 Tax=Desulfotruncus arcticus DSM 17038 TaxID=1121424 RepID=A0A1I2RCG5_9FIRM|nr:response regulator transcription factor [Desulfotruncus arcticus]SFG38384.1 two component transcriptional regulator, LuxR family [Desulfotomaculum arcticum] [Desulfotruncus arcticus DSM 17038]
MIRVLLIDDHEMVRMGLAAYLATDEEIEVIGEASDGEEGVQLALSLRPDVILMDLVMEGMDGIEATRRIIKENPEARIIVLTSFIDDETVYPVIEAGAMSYILKTARAPRIAEAIRAAYKGESILEAKVTGKMIQRMRAADQKLPHEDLTDRELDVLRLIGEGKNNQEIADALIIGIKTVKTHVSHILYKLGVEDRTQAAIYAHRHSLVK